MFRGYARRGPKKGSATSAAPQPRGESAPKMCTTALPHAQSARAPRRRPLPQLIEMAAARAASAAAGTSGGSLPPPPPPPLPPSTPPLTPPPTPLLLLLPPPPPHAAAGDVFWADAFATSVRGTISLCTWRQWWHATCRSKAAAASFLGLSSDELIELLIAPLKPKRFLPLFAFSCALAASSSALACASFARASTCSPATLILAPHLAQSNWKAIFASVGPAPVSTLCSASSPSSSERTLPTPRLLFTITPSPSSVRSLLVSIRRCPSRTEPSGSTGCLPSRF
mmetsp:Transcript_6372/g.16822  ORF Transcript_6372/g.16822 Transcript_6372/m.16822 type:complete len:283 (+) Transcript_6372:215-1063(+)